MLRAIRMQGEAAGKRPLTAEMMPSARGHAAPDGFPRLETIPPPSNRLPPALTTTAQSRWWGSFYA